MVLVACGGETSITRDARPHCDESAAPHDEDGDAVVDVCDNCPAVANPAQTDASEIAAHGFADGVGDACDLRPGVGGDKLRAFYSFESEDQASAWTGSGFTISGDALHATGDARWTSTRAEAGDGLFVIAHIASATFGATGELAITLDGDGIGAGATCALSAQRLVASEAGGTTTPIDLATPIEPMEPMMFVALRTVTVKSTGRVAEILCRVARGGGQSEARLTLIDELVSGTHVIAARDASLDITSVSLYTSPGPKNP